MTCSDKCIHYPVCEQKNWDFANIDECKYYEEKHVVSGEEISCPKDLNQYLVCEPIFENTFSPEECESKKFYGDCYHCFASAIAKRDRQIRQSVIPQGEWIGDTDLDNTCKCSKCRMTFDTDRLKMVMCDGKYELPPCCPNCGAEMKGGAE